MPSGGRTPGVYSQVARVSGTLPRGSDGYAYQEVFFIGGRRETVKLCHADGDWEITVQDLSQEPEEDSARADLVLGDRRGEATGYSDSFDFAEAFRDAIGKLPD